MKTSVKIYIAPKERPILMSGPMVAATLDDRKWQTRRAVKPQPDMIHDGHPYRHAPDEPGECHDPERYRLIHCPYGKPGDRIWVRETFGLVPATAYGASVPHRVNPSDPSEAAIYRAGWERVWEAYTSPPIFMPRWASRLTLEIVSVRAERLQDITEVDAMYEGVEPEQRDNNGNCYESYREGFRRLWDGINGKRPGSTWADNPWVFVIEFRRVNDTPHGETEGKP